MPRLTEVEEIPTTIEEPASVSSAGQEKPTNFFLTENLNKLITEEYLALMGLKKSIKKFHRVNQLARYFSLLEHKPIGERRQVANSLGSFCATIK